MSDTFSTDREQGYAVPERLEAVWGPGFMSPGGPAEVARILKGQSLAGAHVLDLGSGLGGADVALVREHGAARVTGVDVQGALIEGAHRRSEAQGLSDSIFYVHIRPDRLPFPDGVFDVVFTKDALVHVHDKAGILAEMHRVLKPGGRLFVSDWLRGKDSRHDADLDRLIELAGHDFCFGTLSDLETLAEAAGFTGIETEDRNAWYAVEARAELAGLTEGQVGKTFREGFGDEAFQSELNWYADLLGILDRGSLRPGHLRAVRP